MLWDLLCLICLKEAQGWSKEWAKNPIMYIMSKKMEVMEFGLDTKTKEK